MYAEHKCEATNHVTSEKWLDISYNLGNQYSVMNGAFC